MGKSLQKFRLKLARFHRLRLRRPARKLKVASHHPFAVPFITFGVLLTLSLGIFLVFTHIHHRPVRESQIVIISHDHQRQVVPSRQQTVGRLLQKLHIRLNPGDVVEPALATRIDQDEFRVNIYRAVPVKVVDGTQETFTFSAATTPRSIAQQTGSQVYPEDEVITTPSQNFLKDGAIGEQVVIKRATPINLNLYGTPVTIRTHADTVAELIKEENIRLAADDQIMPAKETALTPNAQVFIVRNGTKLETITEPIAMPVQTIPDPGLAYGTSAVRQQGSPGEQVTTYQAKLQNGKVVSRTVIQRIVSRPAVTQIVVTGTSLSGIKGDMARAGIAPSDYNYVDYIISHESGWCPTKAQGQYGKCPPYAGYVSPVGGYGLCQSTPGSKMASAGADWATNPVTQLRWCSGYAHGRYGSWAAAYNHWVAYHSW